MHVTVEFAEALVVALILAPPMANDLCVIQAQVQDSMCLSQKRDVILL